MTSPMEKINATPAIIAFAVVAAAVGVVLGLYLGLLVWINEDALPCSESTAVDYWKGDALYWRDVANGLRIKYVGLGWYDPDFPELP